MKKHFLLTALVAIVFTVLSTSCKKDPILPTVSTVAVSNITMESAVVNAEVSSDGGADVLEYGVCWSLSENPTISDNVIKKGAGIGAYAADIVSLSPQVAYNVRAYATNAVGTSYGENLVFTAGAQNFAYILNSGNFKSNDANLAYYDLDNKKIMYDIFTKMNGKGLGDTAQDMYVFGSKMYIAVFNSQVVFVTDKSGKIISEIKVPMNNSNLSPRYFTSYKDKIYVSYYEGYLGQIDTTSYSVKTVKVGDNPEDIAAAGGKLYVANSGGLNYPIYDKTVSVINPESMTVIKTIDVVVNPQYFEVDSQDEVYLISTGNYADIPNTLQKINPATDEVEVIKGINPTWMSLGANDKIYCVSTVYDAEWNSVTNFSVFDALTDTVVGDFISDGTAIKGAYSIKADKVGGSVFIGASDYVSNGDMYVFSSTGKLVDKFDTGGLNPIGVFFPIEGR